MNCSCVPSVLVLVPCTVEHGSSGLLGMFYLMGARQQLFFIDDEIYCAPLSQTVNDVLHKVSCTSGVMLIFGIRVQ